MSAIEKAPDKKARQRLAALTKAAPTATSGTGAAKMDFAAMREKMKTEMRAAKRGPLRPVTYKGPDPLRNVKLDPENPVQGMVDVLDGLHEVVKEERAKHAGLQNQAANEARAYDTGFYCVLVFDAKNQCDAFVQALKARVHFSMRGDLFLDGRRIADYLGIKIPDPDYSLIVKAFDVKGSQTKRKVLADRDAETGEGIEVEGEVEDDATDPLADATKAPSAPKRAGKTARTKKKPAARRAKR